MQLEARTFSGNPAASSICATFDALANLEIVMSPSTGTLRVWVPSALVYPCAAQVPSLSPANFSAYDAYFASRVAAPHTLYRVTSSLGAISAMPLPLVSMVTLTTYSGWKQYLVLVLPSEQVSE